jgi:branched-chain amino acid transport system permease protein
VRTFVQTFLNGIAIGSVYALFALGYTLIFSILRIINFAHGAVFTLGAYFTYALTGRPFGGGDYVFSNDRLPFSLPFWPAMLIGAVIAGLFNIAIERFAFRPLRKRGSDTLLSLVSSLGISIMIANLIQNVVGADPLEAPEPMSYTTRKPSIMVLGAPIQTLRFLIFAVAGLVMVGLWYLLNRTKTGKALKAVSEDATTSNLLGISTDRLIMFTFGLCGFVAAIAGTMVSTISGITGPYMGTNYGLIGLAVIIIGGLGDIPGAVVGGFVLGVAQALAGAYGVPVFDSIFGSTIKDVIPFLLLFAVLMFRPQGLLGRAQIQKV